MCDCLPNPGLGLLADFVLLFVCLFVCFEDKISLHSPGYPGTCYVDQAGLKLRDPPVSASQVLGLMLCVTMPGCANTS